MRFSMFRVTVIHPSFSSNTGLQDGYLRIHSAQEPRSRIDTRPHPRLIFRSAKPGIPVVSSIPSAQSRLRPARRFIFAGHTHTASSQGPSTVDTRSGNGTRQAHQGQPTIPDRLPSRSQPRSGPARVKGFRCYDATGHLFRHLPVRSGQDSRPSSAEDHWHHQEIPRRAQIDERHRPGPPSRGDARRSGQERARGSLDALSLVGRSPRDDAGSWLIGAGRTGHRCRRDLFSRRVNSRHAHHRRCGRSSDGRWRTARLPPSRRNTQGPSSLDFDLEDEAMNSVSDLDQLISSSQASSAGSGLSSSSRTTLPLPSRARPLPSLGQRSGQSSRDPMNKDAIGSGTPSSSNGSPPKMRDTGKTPIRGEGPPKPKTEGKTPRPNARSGHVDDALDDYARHLQEQRELRVQATIEREQTKRLKLELKSQLREREADSAERRLRNIEERLNTITNMISQHCLSSTEASHSIKDNLIKITNLLDKVNYDKAA